MGQTGSAGGSQQQPGVVEAHAGQPSGSHGEAHGATGTRSGPHPSIRLVPRPRLAWGEDPSQARDGDARDAVGVPLTGGPDVEAAWRQRAQPLQQQQQHQAAVGRSQRAPRADTPPPQRPSPSALDSQSQHARGRSPLATSLLLSSAERGRGDAYGLVNVAASRLRAARQEHRNSLAQPSGAALAADQGLRGSSLWWRDTSPTRRDPLPEPPSLARTVALAQAGMGPEGQVLPGYAASRLRAAQAEVDITGGSGAVPVSWEPEVRALFGGSRAQAARQQQRPRHEVLLGMEEEEASRPVGPPLHETLLGLGHSGLARSAAYSAPAGGAGLLVPASVAAVGARLVGPGGGAPERPGARGPFELGQELQGMLQR